MNNRIHPAQLLFTDQHPLTAAFNMKFDASRERHLTVEVKAPVSFCDCDAELIHTGFNTLLLDTVMGSCAIGELEQLQPIATIKLTCNHLSKAQVGEALCCHARHDGEENGIAYVSGEIRSAADERLLSNAIGSFMIGTASKPIGSKK